MRSRIITVEAEIDLEDYRDEIKEYFNPKYHTVLTEYIKEMEKNLYIYSHKDFKSYEEIYNDLRRIVEENK